MVQSPLVPCTGKEKEDEENKRVRNDDDDDDHVTHVETEHVLRRGRKRNERNAGTEKGEENEKRRSRTRRWRERAPDSRGGNETPSASLPWTKKSDIAKKTFDVGREGGTRRKGGRGRRRKSHTRTTRTRFR